MNNSGKTTSFCDLISDSVPAWTELPESHFSETNVVSFPLPHRGGPPIERQSHLTANGAAKTAWNFDRKDIFLASCLRSARMYFFPTKQMWFCPRTIVFCPKIWPFLAKKAHRRGQRSQKNSFFCSDCTSLGHSDWATQIPKGVGRSLLLPVLAPALLGRLTRQLAGYLLATTLEAASVATTRSKFMKVGGWIPCHQDNKKGDG